jgi:hypothetical protein
MDFVPYEFIIEGAARALEIVIVTDNTSTESRWLLR